MLSPGDDGGVWDDVVFESCVMPHDTFLEMFDSLADEGCERVKVLKELRDACTVEQLAIDRERFGILMRMAFPPFPKSVKKAALDFMIALTRLRGDLVREMVPPELLDGMYQLLMRPRAFKVIENVVECFGDEAVARLLELGVLDLLRERLDLKRVNFETAMSLFEVIVEHDVAKPHAYSLIPRVFEAVEMSPRHEEWVEAIVGLGIIAKDPVAAKIIEESPEFMKLFTRDLVRTRNKIAVLRLLITISKHEKQRALQLMSVDAVRAFLEDLLAYDNEKVSICLCDFFFLLANEEEGREFLVKSNVVASLLEMAGTAPVRVVSKAMLVLAEVAMTHSTGVIEFMLANHYFDAVATNLEALPTKCTQIILDSLINVIRTADLTGRAEFVSAILENDELVDAIKGCMASDDTNVYDTARAITSQLNSQISS